VISPAERDWDRHVALMPSGTPFQRIGWLRARSETDRSGLRLLSGPRLRWVAGVLVTQGPGGSAAWVPRGPAGQHVPDVLAAVRALISIFPESALTVSPYLFREDGASAVERALRDLGFDDGPARFEGATAIVDVAAEDGVLLRRMPDKQRTDLRRMLDDPAITVDELVSDTALEDFHRMYEEFAATRPVSPMASGFLARLRAHGLGRGLGTLLLCRRDGELCSGALILRCGNLAWLSRSPHWPGRPPLGRALQWHAMRWARAQGCRRYDLGGVILEGPGASETAGLTWFKRSLGGVIERTVPSLRRPPG
jgi:hypothetical protein